MAKLVTTLGVIVDPFWQRIRSSIPTLGRGANVFFSVCEYVVVPVLYFAATPILVRALSLDSYGIWMLVASIVGVAGCLDIGLGDAMIRFVALYRGHQDRSAIVRGVRSALGVTFSPTICVGLVVGAGAPFLADRVFMIPLELRDTAVSCINLGAWLLMIRMVETIFSGTIRGYERYDLAAMVSIGIRAATLFLSLVLAFQGYGIYSILLASVMVASCGLIVQGAIVRSLIEASPWKIELHRGELRAMLGFGVYAWLQTVAWTMFSYADRLLIGAFLGTSALAVYSVCLQLAQPIHGAISAGFSVLFPGVSRRLGASGIHGLWDDSTSLIKVSVVGSLILALPVFYFADTILTVWMGREFMEQGTTLLRLLVGSSFVLGVQVVPYFVLIGAGDIRFLSLVSVMGMGASLIATTLMIPITGITAAAYGRLVGNAVATVNFVRLKKIVS
ncbi:MAG: hypothetical protein C5B60_07250 [Chloroflexi bacterium]|nr:MAG: hypothetical protein C5B60_07250 [Chloroflexota bacterium]